MKNINVNKTVLPNGLKIITSYKDSDIFSIGIGIKVGSLYEEEINNGISHMVEHMLFKGTSKRTADELNDDIDKLAGNLDIYTTYHQTVLTIDVMKNKARDCIEIASDMLMNSIFTEKEFKLEKKVIIEEIKMENDDPEDCSYLGLYKSAFPEEWYKYHIAGTMKSVKNIKLEMLEKFYRDYYVSNNTVICIVSSYTHDEILEMVNEFFGSWKSGEIREMPQKSYSITAQRVVRHKTGIAQAHLLYGFDIQQLSKKEEVALTLLNEKIGSGANSVLFRELRDKKGYAYNVYSDIDYITNLKMFYIYAGISEENLSDAIATVDEVIARFKSSIIEFDDGRLKVIKDKFLTDTVIALESSSHIVDYILSGELDYGNPLEYQDFLNTMDTIDINDIRKVINKTLREPIVHILSPR